MENYIVRRMKRRVCEAICLTAYLLFQYSMKEWFHNESRVLLSNVTQRLSGVRTMADPFFKAYTDVMTVVKGVKEAYETVKRV